MSLNSITIEGKTFILVPNETYQKMLEELEDKEDLTSLESKSDTQNIPGEVFHKIILNKENPIKVYREYRGLSRKQLSNLCNVTESYILQLETGKRNGTVKILKNISEHLSVTIEDII